MKLTEQITATLGTTDWVIVSSADVMGDGSQFVTQDQLDMIESGHDHDPGGCTCGCPIESCPPCGGFPKPVDSGS